MVVLVAVSGIVARAAAKATQRGIITFVHFALSGPVGLVIAPALTAPRAPVGRSRSDVCRRTVEHIATPSDDIPRSCIGKDVRGLVCRSENWLVE